MAIDADTLRNMADDLDEERRLTVAMVEAHTRYVEAADPYVAAVQAGRDPNHRLYAAVATAQSDLDKATRAYWEYIRSVM